MEFQDEIHLSVIANALWEGKESGRAAVLIGAGLSRNADASHINASKFPMWGDIAHAIVAHLYSDADSYEFQRAQEQARSTSGALRLADEFVAAHGRSKLDDLLIQTIRDGDFIPGEIHRRIMELPWRDVFTTNYDTLLERAATNVFGRNYSLVTNLAEISTARTPRIIKLHGSMPSQRPFILSEEDFRTYQRKFAPFVNLAQQAMMENIFCLVGFSGDDPNFLAWSGWVRDQLAEWAPRLYLCGLLELNDAKRRLLHERNVTPIDLSPLFSRKEYEPAVRHRRATEYLLDFLEKKRPPNPLRWHDGRPKLPLNVLNAAPKTDGEADAKNRSSVVPYLNQDEFRNTYPGWVIAPASVRDSITSFPLSARLESLKATADLDPLIRLEILDNLNWWLEISLQPLWDPIANDVNRVLREINPFPNTLIEWPATVTVALEDKSSSTKVRQRWLSLALAHLRYLREERRFAAFDEWYQRLIPLTGDSPQHHQRLYYEAGLAALDNADDSRLESILAEWKPHSSDPIWAIRKVGLYTEIGNIAAALTLASEALVLVRRSAKGRNDIVSQSREGWCMKLLHLLNNVDGRQFDYETDSRFRERWEELNELRCNPWIDWGYFEAVLDRPAPEFRTTTKHVGFELGAFRVIRHWGGGNIEKLLPAFQFVRLTEESAMPTGAHRTINSSKILLDAASWFLIHDPIRVPSILCRTFDDGLLGKYFSRYRVATLKQAEIEEWRVRCRRILAETIPKMIRVEKYHMDPNANRAHDQLIMSLNVLKRISMRLSPEQLSEQFSESLLLWGTEPTRRSHVFNDSLSRLLAALVQQMPRAVREKAFVDLATLPIAGEEGRFTLDTVCEDIAAYVADRAPEITRASSPARLKDFVHSLVNLSRTADNESGTRGRLLRRFYWLNVNGLLAKSEARAFCKALWNKVKLDDVPSIRGLHRIACLWCPEPKFGDAARHLKEFILKGPIPPRLRQGLELDDNRFATLWAATAEYPNQKTESGCARIEWTTGEVTQILDAIVEWWREEGKMSAGKEMPWMGDEYVNARLNNVLKTLIRVIIPRVDRSGPLLLQIAEVVDGIQALNYPTEIVLPALLHLAPERKNEIVERLSQAFVSNDEKRIVSSLDAVFFWIKEDIAAKKKKSYYRLPTPPVRLLNELAVLASYRRQPGLLLVLDAIRWVIKDFPKLLSNEFIGRTTTALGCLREETAFGSATVSTQFSLEELPTYRFYAARIAVLLHNLPNGRSRVTDDWMRDILNDALPEVRSCLQNDDEDEE